MDARADPGVTLPVDVELPERYQPVRRVNRGGMASVWCAEDQVLGRRVAVKLLSEPYAHDETAVRRFEREARAAARLSSHPHVVTIYDVGQTKPSPATPAGRAFIVMEYLAGGTVADALRVGAVTEELAMRWLHQAASALDYAHSNGIVHRDVKLANFLLDCDRMLHVADFGIAQLGVTDTVTRADLLFGTAAYLAPERALGQSATEASDIYSLAVAAFELLVGERPFTATRAIAQARQHIEDPPPRASARNRSLPPQVDAVLATGMAKDPEARWETASVFTAALEEALATPRLVAPWPTAPRAIASPRRPSRAVAVGALASAAVALAVVTGTSGGKNAAALRASATAKPAKRAAVAKTTKTPKIAKVTHASPRPVRHVPRRPTIRVAAVQATPAAATTPPPISETLEARAHQLVLAGEYRAAIPLLRQALAAAVPGSPTFEYALHDLGLALLRSQATVSGSPPSASHGERKGPKHDAPPPGHGPRDQPGRGPGDHKH